MTNHIQKAIKADIPQIKAIWEECFTTDQEYLRQVFKTLFRLSGVYVYKEKDEVLSSLFLVPVTYVNNRGSRQRGVYLYAVATPEKARGRQLSVKMVEYLSGKLKQQGENFIITRPAGNSLVNFYRKQGFDTEIKIGGFELPCEFAREFYPFLNDPEKKDKAYPIRKMATLLFNDIAGTYPERFEWDIPTLEFMIETDEFSRFPVKPRDDCHPTDSHLPLTEDKRATQESDMPPFALLKSLTDLPGESYKNGFFNFTME